VAREPCHIGENKVTFEGQQKRETVSRRTPRKGNRTNKGPKSGPQTDVPVEPQAEQQKLEKALEKYEGRNKAIGKKSRGGGSGSRRWGREKVACSTKEGETKNEVQTELW